MYRQPFNQTMRSLLTGSVLCLYGINAPAALLDLGTLPLFLGQTGKPNIFFLVDDSGSMDWEVMTTDFFNGGRFTGDQPDGTAGGAGATVTHRPKCGFGINGQDFFGYLYGVENGSNTYGDDSNDCNTAANNSPRFRNNDFNPMYFNPAEAYPPWAGHDLSGDPFANIDVEKAPDDPYNPTYYIDLEDEGSNWLGGTGDNVHAALTGGFSFYTWLDDGDGIFEDAEFTRYQIGNLSDANVTTAQAAAAASSADTLDPWVNTNGDKAATAEEVKQNFANWYSYYRSREFVAKAAYGRLIANSRNQRMGLATLHNNNTVATSIADMNADPATGDKRTLLKNLYEIFSNSGTPLRPRFRETASYMACDSTNIGSATMSGCPSSSVAEGGSCQQNFAVVMTDGFYNSFYTATSTNHDGDNDTPWDGGVYGDNVSNSMADIAMLYYEDDIHPTLPDSMIPIPGVDEATHQHIVTYTVAFGVEGYFKDIDPDAPVFVDPTDPTFNTATPNVATSGGAAGTATPGTTRDDYSSANGWPHRVQSSTFDLPLSNPLSESPFIFPDQQKIDDLVHAAYNGRGFYLNAQSPAQLTSALNDALADIGSRTSSAASVALNSASLNTDTTLYQARFDTEDWSGQLLAFGVDANGDVATSAKWDAAQVLANKTTGTRQIITVNDATRTAVPLTWANLSAAQQEALGTDFTTDPATVTSPLVAASAAEILSQNRVLYIRDELTDAQVVAAGLRTVNTPLADVVHSAPHFQGAPNFPYPSTFDVANYETFKSQKATRPNLIWVGSNNGVVHAFNESDGDERMAFIPSQMYERIGYVSDPAYEHEYLADGLITTGDAIVNSAWRTVVTGGLRTGGQGMWALDATNTASLTETNASNIFLWEFTDADDADLGFTFSQPVIARMANGKWAVIFGNGYNNTLADGNASTTGHAVLYILFIEEGIDGVWTASSDYIKLDTESGSVGTPNGLSSPIAIDTNSDFIVDYIYAGDLQGNLWKFDVKAASTGAWKVLTNGTNKVPLFSACKSATSSCPAGEEQPITIRPDVGFHPDGEEGFMVYFGTGQYMERDDNSTTGELTQTFYGVWDKNSNTISTIYKSDLLKQEIKQEINQQFDTDADGIPDATFDIRATSDNDIIWHTGAGKPTGSPITDHLGWYIDLYNTNTDTGQNPTLANFGERQVSNPILRGDRVIFTTLIPSDDPCDFGGTGWLMELDRQNGGILDFSAFDFNNDGVFNEEDYVQVNYDADGDGDIDSDDKIAATGKKSQVGIIPQPTILSDNERGLEYKYTSGSTGEIEKTTENPGPGETGRQSWRQLR